MYIRHLITPTTVSLTMNQDGTPTVALIGISHPRFEQIKRALVEKRYDDACNLVDIPKAIEIASDGNFTVMNDVIYMDGEPMPNALSKKLLKMFDNHDDVDHLVNFWKNIKKNPNPESVKDLYDFLEHNHVPITPKGNFVAYKRVTENFLDCHTRTIDNSVGTVVRMVRNLVNDDRNVTCSSGLHVAAFQYANDFYSNGHLVEVLVNPKNVVSVPTDYNQQKMRVCEYKVARLCSGPREEEIYDEDGDYESVYDEDETY
jgi:hypothetical protein